eukprot:TRINITY_DN11593_c0_g1_i1.p1 TRINITY_DN11593_c0_g1~~TRINITY_DN11593_c0_g1_i1.p1  ORF type:complete len:540 (-),score=127.54 TRINITY_DN11593_c0_g1_i1:33-1607(-)
MASVPTQLRYRQQAKDVRENNVLAAKAVADAIRTSLGPRGMDKMISDAKGNVIITNDGATILQEMELLHPTAKMLVDLAKAQDVETGDGTTSVTVIAGALLTAAQKLLNMGIHPTKIAEGFLNASKDAVNILREIARPIDLSDRSSLLESAMTSLDSKVVSQYSDLLAPIAVDAVLNVIDPETATNVDLRNIKIVKKVGGTIDESSLVDGLVFTQIASSAAGGPTFIENAKIGLIQFQLSDPKTAMDGNIVIKDYNEMDRFLKQRRLHIFKMCKAIRATGCNVLLIQKSILRDATSDLSLSYLAKMKIMVIKDIERSDIEFISKTIGAIPCASIESFNESKLGSAGLVEQVSTSGGKIVKVTGIPTETKSVSVLLRGVNTLVLDEADRSLHDALCVVRSLVKEKFLISGGGSPEIEVAIRLEQISRTLSDVFPVIYRAYAEALEVIPYTLAENAGLYPIEIVTELRKVHLEDQSSMGINVKSGTVSDMYEEGVIQPLLVSTSALELATQTVVMILKIDDVILAR